MPNAHAGVAWAGRRIDVPAARCTVLKAEGPVQVAAHSIAQSRQADVGLGSASDLVKNKVVIITTERQVQNDQLTATLLLVSMLSNTRTERDGLPQLVESCAEEHVAFGAVPVDTVRFQQMEEEEEERPQLEP